MTNNEDERANVSPEDQSKLAQLREAIQEIHAKDGSGIHCKGAEVQITIHALFNKLVAA